MTCTRLPSVERRWIHAVTQRRGDRTCLLMWLRPCMLVACKSRAMSCSSGACVGVQGRTCLPFLRSRLRPESVAIMTMACAARWHALSGGALEMVMAAAARMRASSGLWRCRNAAALFCRRAQGRPSPRVLTNSMACRNTELARPALPCLRRLHPASFRSSGDGLETLLPLLRRSVVDAMARTDSGTSTEARCALGSDGLLCLSHGWDHPVYRRQLIEGVAVTAFCRVAQCAAGLQQASEPGHIQLYCTLQRQRKQKIREQKPNYTHTADNMSHLTDCVLTRPVLKANRSSACRLMGRQALAT